MSHNSYLSTESFEWHYMAVGALTIFIVPANQQLVDTPRYTNSTRLQRYARHSMVFFTRFPADIKCLCKKGSRTFVQFIYIYILCIFFYIYSLEYILPFGGLPFALRPPLFPLRSSVLEKGTSACACGFCQVDFCRVFEIIKTTSLGRP